MIAEISHLSRRPSLPVDTDWHKELDKHKNPSTLGAYAEFFGFHPSTKLAKALEGKTIVDIHSKNFGMLAFELAIMGDPARVTSVKPQRKIVEAERLDKAQKIAKFHGRDLKRQDLKVILQEIDMLSTDRPPHEIDLDASSVDYLFDIHGGIYPMKKDQNREDQNREDFSVLETTWLNYLKLLKPEGKMYIVDPLLRKIDDNRKPVINWKNKVSGNLGIKWQDAGFGIKVVKPAVLIS